MPQPSAEHLPEAAPRFSSWLFWDSDPAKLDYRRDRNKVIRRVFELGLIEDVVQALVFYTEAELIAALTSAAYLRENAILLAQALFHLQPKDFRCHTSKQSHPIC